MFWRKCGKLMVNPDGKLSNCPECPCGYYGLFVLEYYTHAYVDGYPDHAGPRCPGDPKQEWWYQDFCSKQLDVSPAHVVNNEIRPYVLSWIIPFVNELTCIPVSRMAQPDGTVADTELDLDYYTTCDNGSYAKFACKVRIYRIGDCFDNYDDFAIFFYSGCGGLPDAVTGKFPDIFQTSWMGDYSYDAPTSAARNCINSNWNTYADKLYRPRCIVNYTNYTFSYGLFPRTNIPGNNSKPEDGGTGSENVMRITDTYCGDSDVDFSIGHTHWCPSCNWGNGRWEFTCCDWWDGSIDALEQVNEWDAAAVDDDTKYCVANSSDTGGEHIINIPGNDMCIRGLQSEAYYGNANDGHYWRQRQYATLKIDKAADTPDNATGIVCMAHMYSQKTNAKFAIEKDKITYVYNQEQVTFKFGEEYRFPTCDNIKPWTFANDRSDCADECVDGATNGDNPSVDPHGWHNNTEIFYANVAFIRYSYD